MSATRPCSITAFPSHKSAVPPVEVPDLRRAIEAVLREVSSVSLEQDASLWPVILAVSQVFPPHATANKITALVYRTLALVRVLQAPAPHGRVKLSAGDLGVEAFQPLLKAAGEARVLDRVEFDAGEFWGLVKAAG